MGEVQDKFREEDRAQRQKLRRSRANSQGDLPPKAMAEEFRFRTGACHAAHWLHDEAKRMVDEEKTSAEISERLAALVHVLQDWREQEIEMPNSKAPWDWDQADLEPYISRRKSEW